MHTDTEKTRRRLQHTGKRHTVGIDAVQRIQRDFTEKEIRIQRYKTPPERGLVLHQRNRILHGGIPGMTHHPVQRIFRNGQQAQCLSGSGHPCRKSRLIHPVETIAFTGARRKGIVQYRNLRLFQKNLHFFRDERFVEYHHAAPPYSRKSYCPPASPKKKAGENRPPRASVSAQGTSMRRENCAENVLPLPGSDSISRCPSCRNRICRTMESPSPVPLT